MTSVINLKDISRIKDLDVITPEVLAEKGIIKDFKKFLSLILFDCANQFFSIYFKIAFWGISLFRIYRYFV